MGKYINKEDAVRILRIDCATKYPLSYLLGIGAAEKEVDDMKSADVEEVRHGEWGFDGLGWTCSECGEYALTNKAKTQVHSRHCPHCGAKMDGGIEG